MTETAGTESLSVEDAVATIEQATGYEEALRRRTEGVTWMVWGVVTGGIQMSFTAGRSFFRPFRDARAGGPPPGWYEPLVILGWLAVGVLLTFAVWRIASVSAPKLAPKPRRTALGGILFIALLYAAIAVLSWLAGGMPEALFPLLAIGAAWLGAGALDVFETTSTGRRTLLVIGAVILAAGAIAVLALPWSGFLPYREELTYDAVSPLVILAGGGVPFLAGLWQTLRG